ncbi:kinase-like domain-containing protein [Kockovaella imperatae]|uniref:cyclin-dependent kinase n=1 Tax=Kockovaella imperatae TaxID=4999 RepID=A0A1Y1UQY8_9TREE|nr:kinase-like domain-containing protein [Kockovaella imperatae]ORX40461.1 kinase-like domain-containing protein [Kockovaella imperatae]
MQDESSQVQVIHEGRHASIVLWKRSPGQSIIVKAFQQDSIPLEILVIRKLPRHRNIIYEIKDVFTQDFGISIALPCLPVSLNDVLTSPLDGRPAVPQVMAHQLCAGLAFLHTRRVAHRDIKPDNVMLDSDGTVVIIDFGSVWTDNEMFRGTSPPDRMDYQVGTGPYRAPELLFGPTIYDPFAVDSWALGCVIGEMLLASDSGRAPGTLFDAAFGDLGLAGSIFRLTGTPTEQTWPDFGSLPDAGKFAFDYREAVPLHRRIHAQPEAIDLVSKLLQLDPSTRLSPAQALVQPWCSLLASPPNLSRSRPDDAFIGAARLGHSPIQDRAMQPDAAEGHTDDQIVRDMSLDRHSDASHTPRQ